MTKRFYIIPCVFILSLGLALSVLAAAGSSGAPAAPALAGPGGTSRFASPAPQVALDTHSPNLLQDSPAAGSAPHPASPGVSGASLQARAVAASRSTRAGAPALADKAVFQENSTRLGEPGLATGDFSLASVQPGVTVDLVYERLYGQLQPGDVVTVIRSADGAYGAAQADGAGFFWTPLFAGDGSGQAVDIVGGDILEVYVNGALETTLEPQEVSGGINVLTDQVAGEISGDTGGTPVNLTFGLWGVMTDETYPTEATITEVDGSFTEVIEFDLGAENMARVEYPIPGGWARGNLYPDPPVFLAQLNGVVAGYAPLNSVVTVTVYADYPDDVRWSGTAAAGFPFGFYQLNGVDLQPGDWVEADLGGGTLLGTSVLDLHTITYDVDLDQVYGFAPTGETVRVSFRDVSDGSETYVETHAAASAGEFSATFVDGDLRPSLLVGLTIPDANGNETSLLSGPPFVEAILDPRGDWDCVVGRVDAPNLPITLSVQTATGTYTRANPIGPSDAGNLVGGLDWCFLVWGPDWGPINFAPGDIVTLQSPSWQGQLTIADLAWQADNANEQVTGSAPSGEVGVSLFQFHYDQYPLNGSAGKLVDSNGTFSASFSGFDLRDGEGNVAIRHFDPGSDFVTQLADSPRWMQADPPWGVYGFTPQMNEPLTAWLYDEAKNLLASTSSDFDGDPYHFWLGDFQGYQLLPGYWITVTTGSGWTAGLQIPAITQQADQATDMVWGEAPKSLLYMDGGRDDSGFGLFTPVDGYAIDTAWLGHDLQFGDSLNTYYSVLNGNRAHYYTAIGELFRVEFWLEPDGSSSMWGEAMPGLEVTITTPRGQFTAAADPGCPGCWYSETGELYPGEEVTVVAGAGLLPVVVTIPDPLSAEVDVNLDQVWGQIGGFTGIVEVHGSWENGYQEVQADGSGNYLASYDDIPRRSEGYVRLMESVDVSYPVNIIYHRPFRDLLSLLIRANYAHEWVEGNYEAGHTIWITLTNSTGDIKATASGVTAEIPWWGGDNNGFSTGYNLTWAPWQPDLEVGDWVYAALDNGQTTDLRIGEISGDLDMDLDTVAGNIYAPWFTQPLNGDCGVWVENGVGQGFPEPVDPNGGSYSCDFAALGWDLIPGQSVGVGYQEPDSDQVYNVFRDPAPNLRVGVWGQGRPGSGGNMVLWVSYQNNGDAPDTGAYISATLGGGLTYLGDTSGFAHTGDGTPDSPLVWQIPAPFQPSPNQTFFEIFVHVDAAQDETVTADAYIGSDMAYFQDDQGAKYSHWEDMVVAFTPDVSVNKWAWTGDPVPGFSFVYAVNVCNFNENAAGSLPVVLTDTLPVSVTLQTWWGQHAGWEEVSSSPHELVVSRPSVPGGWCGEVYLQVGLDAGAVPGVPFVNTAQVATSGDTNLDNNTATSENSAWYPYENLRISKDWVQGTFVPGGEVSYSFQFANAGNLPAEDVVVTSTLPENTSFVRAWEWTPYGEVDYPPDVVTADYVAWHAGTLDNGVWQNVNLLLRIDDGAPASSLLTHTVDINRLPLEERYDDNRITWVDPLNEYGPNLWVNKQNYNWEWEGRLWYEIRVENRGTTWLDNFWITDTYPEGTTLTDWGVNHGPWITATQDIDNRQIAFWVDGLNPGETASISFHLDLDGDLVGQEGLLFTNQVDAPLEGDVYPADNSDQVTAMTGPDVYIEKWLAEGEPEPGEQITFRVRFGNANQWPWNGDVNYGSHITETLPAGMTFITSTWITGDPWAPELVDGNTIVWGAWTMWNSSTYEFNLTVQLDEDVQGGDVLTNRIEAYGDSPDDIDPNLENNIFELPLTVLAPVFEVSKELQSSQVAGMPVRYDLSLANTGNQIATDVVLADTLPEGITYGGSDGSFAAGQVTWEIASLEAGGSAAGWFTGTLTCEAGVEVANQEYGVTGSAQGVTSADGPPVSFTTLEPDIQASFEASAAAVKPGQTVIFTATAATDGTPLSYAWDFGDGETGSGSLVEHAYASPGSYPVELTVTDECGFTFSYSLTVLVAPSEIYLPLVPQTYTAAP